MLTKYLLLSLAAIAAAAARTSSDGKCGGRHQLTCEGSGYGDCCSQYSYCGSSRAYCGKGCQSDFGQCNGDSPALKVSQDEVVVVELPVMVASTETAVPNTTTGK
jgi:hypothetical protein